MKNKIISCALTAGILMSCIQAPLIASASDEAELMNWSDTVGSSQDNGDGTYNNPVLFTDVADPDVVRIGDAYYLVSTAMQYSPGAPIMKSYDLVNWETVSYVYDSLDYTSDALSLENGKDAYGWGQWATAIKYHNGNVYVLFSSYTTGKSYLYETTDIENGPWKKSVIDYVFHDPSFVFDGDRLYAFYGQNGEYIAELVQDADGFWDITPEDKAKHANGETIGTKIIDNMGAYLTDGTEDFIIAGEGVHAYKIDGRYYIIFISWPGGTHWKRLMACYRSVADENGGYSITGPYEGKLIMEETLGYAGGEGIAQGGMCSVGDWDTPYDATTDGDGSPVAWKGIIYQDRGPVGRTPMLIDVTWEDGWPMMSAVRSGEKPIKGDFEKKSLTLSDEFDNDSPRKTFDAITKESVSVELMYAGEPEETLSAEETSEVVELLGASVLSNGDMEYVDENNGVGYWGGTEADGVKTAQAEGSTDAHTGNHSLRVYDRESAEAGAMQYLSVTPDTEYVAKAYVKHSGAEEETFKLQLMNNYWQPVDIGSVTAQPNEWGEISGEFTAPSDFGGGFIRVISEKTNEEFLLDDVSIEEKPQPEEPKPDPGQAEGKGAENILNNPGFENGVDADGLPNWWHGYNGAAVSVTDEIAPASGEYCAKLSERPEGGSGAGQYVDLIPGASYRVSFKVYYKSGSGAPDSEKFSFALSNNWTDAYTMASGKVKPDTWTMITNTFTVPKDFDMGQVYTVADTNMMDYYIDDLSMTLQRAAGDEIIVNGDLETGVISPWSGRDGAAVEIASEPYIGGYSMKATNRATAGGGPLQDVTGRMKPGRKYNISARIKYSAEEAPEKKTFLITLESKNAEGAWRYDSLVNADITKDAWGEISGVVTVPEDVYTEEMHIYIENPYTPTPGAEDTFDFLADEISVIQLPEEANDPAEYEYNGSNLKLAWQWNHNPDNRYWSLTERPGYLRLTNGSIVNNIQAARNTLTQRSFGPQSSGWVKMDISGMKKGDIAGMSTMQVKYGNIGVKMYDDGSKHFVWQYIKEQAYDSTEINDDNWRTIPPQEVDLGAVPDGVNDVYLKIEYDFHNYDHQKKDSTAYFYYGTDGVNWNYAGELTGLYYHLYQFTGYKFALFNYGTKRYGGYVDFDYFRADDGRTSEKNNTVLAASVSAPESAQGVPGTEFTAKINMDAFPAGVYDSYAAALNIPEGTEVTGVKFNDSNISGNASYEISEDTLKLTVSGENVSFANNGSDKSFAEISFRVTDFVTNESKFPKDDAALKADKKIKIAPSYIAVSGRASDGSELDYNISGADVALKFVDFGAVSKFPGNGNTLMSHRYGADPFAMEYDGRLYIYMSSDNYEYDSAGNLKINDYANIKTISVISTTDMINWVDHGEIPVAGADSSNGIEVFPGLENGAAKWAANSWAPSVCHKTINGQEKFFLYFGNNGSSLGVLEGDSPIGPFRDPTVSEEYPNGHALIDGSTPGMEGRQAWMFDPAVLVDDDGQGYLYFGGGIPYDGTENAQTDHPKSASVIKLGDDMVSTVGEAVEIDAPAVLEDSGIHKYGGRYYYSYCTNFSGEHENNTIPYGSICYMVSDNPMGPFEYIGEILPNMYQFFRLGGNNHHAIFQYNGEWYITYHSQIMAGRELEANAYGSADGMGYRSSHVDKIKIYSDGTIGEITATRKGAPQIESLNPYTENEAETIAWQKGIAVSDCAEEGMFDYNRSVSMPENGSWLGVSGADFKNGAKSFSAKVKSDAGAVVGIYIDTPAGQKIGELNISATNGAYESVSCDVQTVSGEHNVFFVSESGGAVELDRWSFAPESDTEVDITEAYSADDGAHVSAEVRNLVSDAELYIAAYNADGRLLEAKKYGASQGVTEAVLNKDAAKVKAYLWESGGQAPLCEEAEASVK